MNAAEIRSRYWAPLEMSHKPSAWDVLNASYGDSMRAYHSWSHVAELLEGLEQTVGLAARPELIATAIFWHDVVYQTHDERHARRADSFNVRDSAKMFRRYTLLAITEAEAVQELIMATADHLHSKTNRECYVGFSRDMDLFLDLDLSPLAAPWSTFASNFEAIRFEFSWVPQEVFNAAQGAFLRSLLANEDKLFRRPETIERWRGRALANITRCLNCLESDEGIAPKVKLGEPHPQL